ncbi:MAG: choice-of-anchor Q domain-containing protein, partial [Methylovulum sp.]
LALATGSAPAATLNVSGACTLVNAINNANSDTDTDGNSGCGAGSGDDTLELTANATYILTENLGDLYESHGLPLVTSSITINGNGATIERSNAPETPQFRLLHVDNTGNLTINQLKLTGGYVFYGTYQTGAGILNAGNLTINNSTITNNSGAYLGGGISHVGGILNITDSTISNNEARYSGGGIRIRADNPANSVTLTNSIVSGNVSNNAGGILSYGSTSNMLLVNSTVSGNNGDGIALYEGTLTLISSTVSSNVGYGLAAGSVTLINSLIANNAPFDDCSAFITLLGVNLIEDGSCGAPLIGDPKLRTLLDNGGPTLTHALPGDSPAIAAADPTLCEAADQRGVRRPHSCDLGAFERKSKIPESVAPLVAFFDAQVESNGLSGHVAGETVDRRIALRNQLLTAGDYLNRHLKTDACAQLTRTLGYIDPDNKPEADDYVTGNGGGLLIDEINTLRGNWSCS